MDNDCDGTPDDGLDFDNDDDGHYSKGSCTATPRDDCNDNDATIHEVCNQEPDDPDNPDDPGDGGDGGGGGGGPSDDPVSCDFTLSATDSTVAPQKTGSSDTSGKVSVTLADPAPEGGCTISLSYVYVLSSGGHDHTNVPQGESLIGRLNAASVKFEAGESGAKEVTYTSGEIAGKFNVTATESKAGSATVTLEVKVGGLYTMTDTSLTLTGSTDYHKKDNHYATIGTKTSAVLVADKFSSVYNATLGINDMSLPYGGVFAICGTWDTDDTCSNATDGGHDKHREGKSLDIDKCAKSLIENNPNSRGTCKEGYIKVDKNDIRKWCLMFGPGTLANETPIHCEFTY